MRRGCNLQFGMLLSVSQLIVAVSVIFSTSSNNSLLASSTLRASPTTRPSRVLPSTASLECLHIVRDTSTFRTLFRPPQAVFGQLKGCNMLRSLRWQYVAVAMLAACCAPCCSRLRISANCNIPEEIMWMTSFTAIIPYLPW